MAKKYDLSRIMKDAWRRFRDCSKMRDGEITFAEALCRAWKQAKYERRIDNDVDTGCERKIRDGVCRMDHTDDTWTVTGQTFGAKEKLKKFGFKWNGKDRCWFTNDRNVAKAFANIWNAA